MYLNHYDCPPPRPHHHIITDNSHSELCHREQHCNNIKQGCACTTKLCSAPETADIPRMQLNVELDEDVATTKSCGGSICHIQRKLSETLLKQELYYKAAKMFM